MDTAILNEYLFANLVTQWATQIASARASSRGGNPTSSDAATAVTTEDLRAALAQLEMRRRVVQGLREMTPSD
jgi:hypothetical protein